MRRPFYARYGPVIFVVMVLALPWISTGVVGAFPRAARDVRDWLPRGFEETKVYEWFLGHFGSDEIAVVSWPGCTLDDERVDRLAQALVADGATEASRDARRLFDRAFTGRDVLQQLRSPPLNLSDAEARRRLRGTLVGPDGRTTCVVVVVSEDGALDRPAAVERIYQTAEAACRLSRETLRLGGPTIDGAAMDAESVRSLRELLILSIGVGLLVGWLRLKSVRVALMVFIGALYAAGVTVAVLYCSGMTLGQTLPVLPALVYLLSISAGVHLVNYYHEALDKEGPAGAPGGAVARGWLPCVLAAGTTAVGLLSLAASKTIPVRMFGVYGAIGMAISVTVVLLFLPSALQCWPVRPPRAAGNRAERSTRTIGRVTGLLSRFHAVLTGTGVALMVLLGCGLMRLESTVKLQDRFSPTSRIMADYRWLEEHLGALVPMEVVVRFDRACPLTLLERLEVVGAVQREIERVDGVAATMSALTFAPPLPQGRSPQDVVRRLLLEAMLLRSRRYYTEAHYLAEDPKEQLWRISVRVNALNDIDYGYFVDSLRQSVEPLLEGAGGRTVAGAGPVEEGSRTRPAAAGRVAATYTGGIPLIYKAQRVLLRDLVESFCLAFLAVTLVMILALRRGVAGLLAMVPNVFPTILVFGGMGWLGWRVNIGSVVTASVALGIAVDDTFHFLTWFRRGIRQGMCRHAAIRFAYERCAGAMVHTTIICVSGLLVFVLSTFMPTVRFAWMMAALLAAALAGDLILLPAILAGPLGRFFQREREVNGDGRKVRQASGQRPVGRRGRRGIQRGTREQ